MERFHEDKQQVLTMFRQYLQVTSNGRNIQTIVYEKVSGNPDHPEWFDEYAVCTFKDGTEVRVNITADSGTAMAKDIINKLF